MRLIVILWYARSVTVIFYLFSCYSSSINYSWFFIDYHKTPIESEDYAKYWAETFDNINNFFNKNRSKSHWILLFIIFCIVKTIFKFIILGKDKDKFIKKKIVEYNFNSNDRIHHMNNSKPEFYEPIKEKLDQFHMWKEGLITWDEIDWQTYYWETLLPRVDDFDEHYQFRMEYERTWNQQPSYLKYNNFIDIYSSLISTPSCLFLILFLLPVFLYVIYFICNFFSFRKKP